MSTTTTVEVLLGDDPAERTQTIAAAGFLAGYCCSAAEMYLFTTWWRHAQYSETTPHFLPVGVRILIVRRRPRLVSVLVAGSGALGVVGEALPVDDHAGLIADDPSVVSGWEHHEIAGAELGFFPVVHTTFILPEMK